MNAIDEVKAVADGITDSNDSDGVAKYIERILQRIIKKTTAACDIAGGCCHMYGRPKGGRKEEMKKLVSLIPGILPGPPLHCRR